MSEHTRRLGACRYISKVTCPLWRSTLGDFISTRIEPLSEIPRNMLCAVCETIPLDLFLPTRDCEHTHHDGRAWLGSVYHLRAQDLQESGANGCVMCRLLLAAMDTGRSVDGIPPEERAQETEVMLRCVGEGTLRVSEYGGKYPVRTGILYWLNQGTNVGRRPGESGTGFTPTPAGFCADQATQPRLFCRKKSVFASCFFSRAVMDRGLPERARRVRPASR